MWRTLRNYSFSVTGEWHGDVEKGLWQFREGKRTLSLNGRNF
jgi:hypothetical protein